MKTITPTPTVARRPPGRAALLLGAALGLLAPVLYIVQIQAKILRTPWYLPVAGAVAAAVILATLFRKVTVTRVVLALLFTLLAAFEWYGVVSALRLPAYAGPATPGQPFPTFASARADGAPFTQDDLKGDGNTVLVFFRGHW
jgi:4-amino-4-deoxy-L-arabinose transferase-like glycosyltransferase